MRMRLPAIAAAIWLITCPAMAGMSVVPKAQGSTGWLQDMGQDSATNNIRPLVYLLSPASGNAVEPLAASAPGVMPPSGNTISVQPPTTNLVKGTANTAATTTTSLVAAVASKKLYITSFSCTNTGSTTSLISFQDGSGGATLWTVVVGATGGGSNLANEIPLFWTTAGNALFFAAASASTTIYCSASGYSGD